MTIKQYPPLSFSGKSTIVARDPLVSDNHPPSIRPCDQQYFVDPLVTLSHVSMVGFVTQYGVGRNVQFERVVDLAIPTEELWWLLTSNCRLRGPTRPSAYPERPSDLCLAVSSDFHYYPLEPPNDDFPPSKLRIYPLPHFEQQIGYLTAIDELIVREAVAAYFRLKW